MLLREQPGHSGELSVYVYVSDKASILGCEHHAKTC